MKRFNFINNPINKLILVFNEFVAFDCDRLNKVMAEKADFLGGLVVTFKEQMHTDVLVKPADEGLPIPSHKAVLVTSLCLFTPYISDQTHSSSLNLVRLY